MIPRVAMLVIAVAAARIGLVADRRLADPVGGPLSVAMGATLVVALVLLVRPRTRPATAGAIGFAAAAALELAQLAGLPLPLDGEFTALDLLWCAGGAALGAVACALVLRAVAVGHGRRSPGGHP